AAAPAARRASCSPSAPPNPSWMRPRPRNQSSQRKGTAVTKSRCPSSDRACCRDLAEVWAPVPGYEGMYDVSADGRVMRAKHITGATTGRVLKPDVNHRGYHKVRLFDGRGIRTSKVHSVHRLVAAAFLGPCPPGHQVNHKDADKGHNCLANLEYVTPKQNI